MAVFPSANFNQGIRGNIMISDLHTLDRKKKESIRRIERNYERLCIRMTPQSFVEVLAEFSREIASNSLFEPYIKSIKENEEAYRKTPDIASIIEKASFKPTGNQELNQEMLRRTEQNSEYLSLWLIIRFNELYDISLHERVRNELMKNNDIRGLEDFNRSIIIISDILYGKSDLNLARLYLPHAHRVMSEIIQFFDKRRSIREPDGNNSYSSLVKTELIIDEQEPLHEKIPQNTSNFKNPNKLLVSVIFSKDEIRLSTANKEPVLIKKYDHKKRQDNLRFKLLTLLQDPHSKELSKRQLEELFKEKYEQVNRARRGINDRVIEEWGYNYDDLIKRDRITQRMTFNDKYNIVFK